MTTRICPRCGKEYQPKSGMQKWCIDCRPFVRKEHAAQWQKENADHLREYNTGWRHANPEKVKACDARKRAGRESAANERSRLWRLANPGSGWLYLKKHPDKRRVYAATYRGKHWDAIQAGNEKHRALKTANTPKEELLTASQWRAIVEEYGHKCVYCGRELDKPTMDHVVPLSRGGRHTKDNVVPACQSCNSSKNGRLLSEWRMT